MDMRISTVAEAVFGIEWAPPVNSTEAAWRLRGLDHDTVRNALQTKLGDATADAMRGTWDPGDAQLPADWSPPSGAVRVQVGPCGANRRVDLRFTTVDDDVGIEISMHIGHAVTGARRPRDVWGDELRDFVDAPLGDAADFVRAAWLIAQTEGVGLGAGERTAVAWVSALDGSRMPAPVPSSGVPTHLIAEADIMSPLRLSEPDLLREGVDPWATRPDENGTWPQHCLESVGSTRLVALFEALAAFEARRASWTGASATAAEWAALERALRRRDTEVLTTLLDRTHDGVFGGLIRTAQDPRNRWFRPRLKRIAFSNVTEPTGRELAALDYAEVALKALDGSDALALSERCPSFEEMIRAANAIAFDASQAAVRGATVSRAICQRHLRRHTRLDGKGRRRISAVIVEKLDEFRRNSCAVCPTRCLGRKRPMAAPAFFSAGHPIEPALASKASIAAADAACAV